MNWTQKEIQKVMTLCKSKAMTDNKFRLKLLNDPAAAVKDLTGKEIPQDVKLQVLEQDPSADMAFILPPSSSVSAQWNDGWGLGLGEIITEINSCQEKQK